MFFTTIISLGSSDTTEMLGYAGDIITDLTPIWLPIISISVGLLVVLAVIRSIRG